MSICSAACQELTSTALSANPLFVAAWHAAYGHTTGVTLPAVPSGIHICSLQVPGVEGFQNFKGRGDYSHCS